MHEVTLPEGLRLDEIALRLQAAGISDADEFLARARDPVLARRKGLEADSFEGYAYPETYRFRRDTPPEELLGCMLDELRRRLTAEDFAAIEKSGLTLHEVVTLASIVEKESVPGPERPLIASVYRNRLTRGMRLQSAPAGAGRAGRRGRGAAREDARGGLRARDRARRGRALPPARRVRLDASARQRRSEADRDPRPLGGRLPPTRGHGRRVADESLGGRRGESGLRADAGAARRAARNHGHDAHRGQRRATLGRPASPPRAPRSRPRHPPP